jgi:hypothetical protein
MLMLHNGLHVAFSTSFESPYKAEWMGRVGSTRPNMPRPIVYKTIMQN